MKGIYGRNKDKVPKKAYNGDLTVYRLDMRSGFEMLTREQVGALEDADYRVRPSDTQVAKNGKEFELFIKMFRFSVLNPFGIESSQYKGARLDTLVVYPPKDDGRILYPTLKKKDMGWVINEEFNKQPMFDIRKDKAIMDEIDKLTSYFDGLSKMSMSVKLPVVHVSGQFLEKIMKFEDGDSKRYEFRVYPPYADFVVKKDYKVFNRPTELKSGASEDFAEKYRKTIKECRDADAKKIRGVKHE